MSKRIKRLFTKYNANLIKELVSAEFKTYEGNSILGILWSLLNPAVTLAIMFCVFEKKFGHHINYYPLFLLIGVIIVNFFIDATTNAFRSIFFNQNVILNTAIPREDLILVPIIVRTYKLLIEIFLCCLLSVFYGVFSWQFIFLALPLLAALVGLMIGTNLVFSLLFCFARDIEHIWRILSRLFLFITPVFYTLDQITPLFKSMVYWLNPLTPFLISLRQIIIWDNSLNMLNYLYSLLLGFGLLIFGFFIFTLLENTAVEAL